MCAYSAYIICVYIYIYREREILIYKYTRIYDCTKCVHINMLYIVRIYTYIICIYNTHTHRTCIRQMHATLGGLLSPIHPEMRADMHTCAKQCGTHAATCSNTCARKLKQLRARLPGGRVQRGRMSAGLGATRRPGVITLLCTALRCAAF